MLWLAPLLILGIGATLLFCAAIAPFVSIPGQAEPNDPAAGLQQEPPQDGPETPLSRSGCNTKSFDWAGEQLSVRACLSPPFGL
jgi:hypothetical protein